MAGSHYLPIPQPWGWAVVTGQLEVANCHYPPQDALLGQRIGIHGAPNEGHWWIAELHMGALPRVGQGLDKHCLAEGFLGTAELVGWMHVAPGCKVLEQRRAGGDETPLRTRKGVIGPIAWVLRKPKQGGAAPTGAKRLLVYPWETKAYRKRLLEYATLYGCDGMTPHHLGILTELGFREPLKGK